MEGLIDNDAFWAEMQEGLSDDESMPIKNLSSTNSGSPMSANKLNVCAEPRSQGPSIPYSPSTSYSKGENNGRECGLQTSRVRTPSDTAPKRLPNGNYASVGPPLCQSMNVCSLCSACPSSGAIMLAKTKPAVDIFGL